MRIAIVVALAGCGRIGFDAGAANDAAGSADAAAFADGKLVIDASCDAGFDEDGDGVFDQCDACPPFATGPGDADHDGVLDACDPNPSVPGDRIVYFHGFNGTPFDLAIDGSWTFDGAAHVTGALDSETAVTWPAPATTTGNYTVFAAGTIDAVFGTSVARPVGVIEEWNAATTDGIECVFGIDPSNAEVFALADNKATSAIDNEPATANVGDASTFRLHKVGDSYTCDGTAAATQLSAVTTVASVPNRIGVFARSTSATFQWLMIVESP